MGGGARGWEAKRMGIWRMYMRDLAGLGKKVGGCRDVEFRKGVM